ncbi:MAG: hypothetical protein AVDCRST_MAG74-1856 [uncultured Pyrinomonadaceae bacterium]|uniref:Uncharacterized protein n=1 Tax=uncultured Pyrinomonadaceae bacterium TaxID=2283094 RepID=A0A6J4P5E9_9BACT|nr:MAG: hypothetical protein AVDCRST_MAG74-1856 [uncultured Pyrinomonadaceae bacterium]
MKFIQNIFKLTVVFMMVGGIFCVVGNAKSSVNEEAVKQLRKSGDYDSLQKTFADSMGNMENESPAQAAAQNKVVGIGQPTKSFGESVAISGDTAIVGAPLSNFGPNVEQGMAFIFVKNGASWTQQGLLLASDGALFDNFGSSVAISGNTAIVGAEMDDVNGVTNQGSVYVFVRNGNSWTLQTRLTAPDGAADDRFGGAVAFNGAALVVGASGDDVNSNINQGSAYVYAQVGNGWNFLEHIFATDGAATDFFGGSVSISGITIIVGAASADINSNNSQGAAYIFSSAGNGFEQQAKLVAPDGAASDSFGNGVSIFENTAIVGAYLDDIGTNNNQGSAYVYVKNGNVWTLQAKLFAADGALVNEFGGSVSISYNKIIIGAERNGNIGAAYVFVRNSGTWKLQNKLVPADGVTNDNFGASVAISGNNVIVGADRDDIGNNADQGSAYLFNVVNRTPDDFDGDGRSDISVFRPSNGSWYINQSTAGFTGVTFGLGTDLLAPADYDGDGKTDVAVFRNGNWYYLRSTTNSFVGLTFGLAGDVPIPADYDGDGKADVNVFRPSDGGWYRLNSSNGAFVGQTFGQNGDKPLIADFDGDGKTDITVFRPSSSAFYSLDSSSGNFRGAVFGFGTDIPTLGDYDGDDKTDISVFRSSDGGWYRLNSANGAFVGQTFGQNGDVPVAADYDGDGKTDVAVFRNGEWYRLNSINGAFVGQSFGFGTDKPIPAALQ